LEGLTGTGNEWLVRQRLSLVHRALQEVEPYEDHLTPAVQQLERALQVCPEPQAGQETPALHSAMGDLLRLRHERNGDAEDYRRARVHTERGVLLARDPGMAPGWAVRVSNHALVLAAKRRREDVHAAEQLLREALGSDHVHPDDEAVLRHNLGTVLREAGAAMQDGAQLREAEQALRHAVRLTSVATAVGRLARRNLALALYSRWELDRKTSHVPKKSSRHGQTRRGGGEGVLFVEELPGLQAVVELADHAVEQVPLRLGMPVSVVAPSPVVGGGSGRGREGGEGPLVTGVGQAVVLDVAASDEAFLARGLGD